MMLMKTTSIKKFVTSINFIIIIPMVFYLASFFTDLKYCSSSAVIEKLIIICETLGLISTAVIIIIVELYPQKKKVEYVFLK